MTCLSVLFKKSQIFIDDIDRTKLFSKSTFFQDAGIYQKVDGGHFIFWKTYLKVMSIIILI